MKIIAKMKDGTEKKWKWANNKFALVCLRYITELQKDLEENKTKYITLINDDGEVWMKKGLKMLYWDCYKNYTGGHEELLKL